MTRVLVVDDRPDCREQLVALLRYAGHETLEAGDGSEALQMIRAKQPDLVITDILMPGMATACGTPGIVQKPANPETILATIVDGMESDQNGSALSDDESFDRVHLRLVNRKLFEKVAELETVNLERRKLLAGLVNAQENERSRIASDIHDDSIQIMAAVALRLEMLGEDVTDPEQSETLSDIADKVAQAVRRLRFLILDLNPQSLESGGLGRAIGAYVREVAAEAGFTWRIDDALAQELPDDVEVILYRIAQEAVRNAQKHAQARTVVIALSRIDGGTTLRVADDGVGFEPAEATKFRPGHLGLTSIRGRATMAGGRFELESAPGAGCAVEVWVPDAIATQ